VGNSGLKQFATTAGNHSEWLGGPSGTVTVDHIICIKTICPSWSIHILWEQPSQGSQTSEMQFVFGPRGAMIGPYISHKRGLSGSLEGPLNYLSIIFPLQMIHNLSKKVPHTGWHVDHLDERKGWLEIWDTAKDMSAELHIHTLLNLVKACLP
jgi:hypothetical protein